MAPVGESQTWVLYHRRGSLSSNFLKNSRGFFGIQKSFFEKGIAFFMELWYNIMRLRVHFALEFAFIRRCIEVVITVSTRNRVASKIARGFESHRLRQ